MSTWLAGLGALSKSAAEGVIRARQMKFAENLKMLQQQLAEARLAQQSMYEQARLAQGSEAQKWREQFGRESLLDRQEARAEAAQAHRDSLKQNLELTKLRLAMTAQNSEENRALRLQIAQWTREYQQSELGLRREMIELRKLQIQQAGVRSKVPQIIQSRVMQAFTILNQTKQIRRLLADPDLRRFMGPAVGQAGFVTRRLSPTVQRFENAMQSLIALNPILHAYRGGAQTHRVFEAAEGNLTYTPEALEGGFDAIDALARNILSQGEALYPNDPFFESAKRLSATGLPEEQDNDGGALSLPSNGGGNPPQGVSVPTGWRWTQQNGVWGITDGKSFRPYQGQ